MASGITEYLWSLLRGCTTALFASDIEILITLDDTVFDFRKFNYKSCSMLVKSCAYLALAKQLNSRKYCDLSCLAILESELIAN